MATKFFRFFRLEFFEFAVQRGSSPSRFRRAYEAGDSQRGRAQLRLGTRPGDRVTIEP